MKTVSYFGREPEVVEDVAELLEAERRQEAAQARSDRRHLSKRTEQASAGGGISEFWDPTFDLVARRMRLDALRRAMGMLSGRDKEVLRLYYWEGKTMQDIGFELGVSRMAISKRLKRIHGQLRESMQ